MVSKKKPALADYLNRKEAAEYIGLSDFWLERHCNDPEAPRWFKHGRKAWYKRTDLEDWLRAREAAREAGQQPWRIAEARKIPVPSAEELEASHAYEWGDGNEVSKTDAKAAYKKLLSTLSERQLALLNVARGAK